MPIDKGRDVTGERLRQIRLGLRLTMKEFWTPIGCTVAQGHAYETGRTDLPQVVRKLLWLHYEIGVPMDFSSAEFRRFKAMVKKGGWKLRGILTRETMDETIRL